MFKIIAFSLMMIVTSTGSQRLPEFEIKVLIVDTGIGPHKKLTNVQYDGSTDFNDHHGHGTHIAGLVQLGKNLKDPVCKNVKIYSCKYYDKTSGDLTGIAKCLNRANVEKFDYVNVSGGGPTPLSAEFNAIKSFKGTVFAATGNEGLELNDYYQYFPASYSHSRASFLENMEFKSLKPLKNVKMIQALCSGSLCSYSNYHPLAINGYGDFVKSTLPNNRYGSLRGTSQATAIALHGELKSRCLQLKGVTNVTK